MGRIDTGATFAIRPRGGPSSSGWQGRTCASRACRRCPRRLPPPRVRRQLDQRHMCAAIANEPLGVRPAHKRAGGLGAESSRSRSGRCGQATCSRYRCTWVGRADRHTSRTRSSHPGEDARARDSRRIRERRDTGRSASPQSIGGRTVGTSVAPSWSRPSPRPRTCPHRSTVVPRCHGLGSAAVLQLHERGHPAQVRQDGAIRAGTARTCRVAGVDERLQADSQTFKLADARADIGQMRRGQIAKLQA